MKCGSIKFGDELPIENVCQFTVNCGKTVVVAGTKSSAVHTCICNNVVANGLRLIASATATFAVVAYSM